MSCKIVLFLHKINVVNVTVIIALKYYQNLFNEFHLTNKILLIGAKQSS